MQVQVTVSYTPSITHEAGRLLPSGTSLKLGAKITVDVPEIPGDEADVAFVFKEGGRTETWRRRRKGWLRPLGTEAGFVALEKTPRQLDAWSLADLAAAGCRPERVSATGLAWLAPGLAVQEAAAGEALYRYMERQNPSSPAQGRNRNIIDSGDLRRREAEARAAWHNLGAVIIDGKAWHAVAEPVIVVQRGGRVSILPSNSEIAEWNRREGRTYPMEDWEKAFDASEAETGRRPSCSIEWIGEPSALPAP